MSYFSALYKIRYCGVIANRDRPRSTLDHSHNDPRQLQLFTDFNLQTLLVHRISIERYTLSHLHPHIHEEVRENRLRVVFFLTTADLAHPIYC